MLDQSSFREVISGRRRGPAAALLRGAFRLAELPYTWAVSRRNQAFDAGTRPAHRVSAAVVSVGNLTVGGTGKSPMVAWLVHWFQSHGISVAVVSRGYKAGTTGHNDEAQELAQALPGVPHLQNPDRVAAARVAVDSLGCRAIVLDDAFQHRHLARDLDIVLIDALEPFGYGHVLPRGTLREPLEGLSRAHVVVLTRADLVDEIERARIQGIVERHAPHALWAECRHAPRALRAASGAEAPLSALRDQRIGAFCGIGNPAGFRRTLDQCGYRICARREFPDHHRYTDADLADLASWAAAERVTALICTQKDLVKLATDSLGSVPVWAIRIEIDFLAGQDALESRLQELTKAMPRPPNV